MALTGEKKAELLNLNPNTITVNEITRLFGYTTKMGSFERIPPKFDVRETVHLEPHEYINEEAIDTTVGSILFNKLMVEGSGIQGIVPGGFFDGEITKKRFGQLSKIVSDGLRNEKIPLDPVGVEFLRNYENWGLRLTAIFSPSYTMRMVKPDPTIKVEKEEALKNTNLSNVEDMIEMENKLVKAAHKATAGDPGKTLFDSGSRGSFENDFKNMALFIGPVQNPVTGEYDFMTSNYMEGLKKEDLVGAGNIVVGAEFPKAIGTARGGYLTKQFYAVLQTLVLDDNGTDCGSVNGFRITLTPDNAQWFIDQNFMTTKGPMLLTEETAQKVMGKSVLIRSPMYCCSDKICSVCAGKRLYQMETPNMGLLTVNMSNNLMQKNLKLRHSMKMDVDHVDPDSLIL